MKSAGGIGSGGMKLSTISEDKTCHLRGGIDQKWYSKAGWNVGFRRQNGTDGFMNYGI